MTARGVSATDAGWVFRALGSWERSYRWSAHGCTPNMRVVHELLLAPLPWQVVLESEAGDPVALVQIILKHEVHGFGNLGLLVDRATDALEVGALTETVRSAMITLGVRKLCLSSVDGEIEPERWFGDAISEVGRLSGHERQVDGSYADLLMHELWPRERSGG